MCVCSKVLFSSLADVPTDDSEEVMVRMDIHEHRGRSLYLICNSTVDENDYSLVCFPFQIVNCRELEFPG